MPTLVFNFILHLRALGLSNPITSHISAAADMDSEPQKNLPALTWPFPDGWMIL